MPKSRNPIRLKSCQASLWQSTATPFCASRSAGSPIRRRVQCHRWDRVRFHLSNERSQGQYIRSRRRLRVGQQLPRSSIRTVCRSLLRRSSVAETAEVEPTLVDEISAQVPTADVSAVVADTTVPFAPGASESIIASGPTESARAEVPEEPAPVEQTATAAVETAASAPSLSRCRTGTRGRNPRLSCLAVFPGGSCRLLFSGRNCWATSGRTRAEAAVEAAADEAAPATAPSCPSPLSPNRL